MRPDAGFSLIEIMITLSLIAIICAFSIAGLNTSLEKQKQNSKMAELGQALLYARNYAITHHSKVSLCPSQNHHNCGENWSQGIIVFSGKKVLLELPELPYKHQLILKAFPHEKLLEFNAFGILNSDNGKFIYRLANGTTKTLLISKTGRIRFSTS